MSRLHTLATRHAGRPVLMLPNAALEVGQRLQAVDARAFERPSRLSALLKKLSLGSALGDRRPAAMEDDEAEVIPFETRAAYAPLYAGEPEDLGFCWSLIQGVALMQCDTPLLDRGEDVCGVVYHGYDTLLQAMREASADERVKAIFLRMSSPGGVVAGGLADLSAFMRSARAAAGGKPIWVFADMACSAAYWIAAAADKIIAPKVGLVGSIGAVLVHEDYSGALEKYGLKIEAIQFGSSKTDGAWWAALSPTARADLQAEIDQCGRNFIADVTAGRPQLTAEALIATQAAVYMAEHDEPERSGLALGFVDEIKGEAEAFADLVALVSTPEDRLISPAAVGGRAATSPGKDAPMAERAQANTGRSAQARAEAARLRAEAEALEAEADQGEDTANGGGGEDTLAGGEGEDTLAGGGADDDVEAKDDAAESEAQAIANSPEGKANPEAAVQAISAGLTLAQFKAMQPSAQGGRGRGQLSVVMADSKRLGPDAAAPTKAPATAGAQFTRNLQKGLEARKRG